jgi:hypothetical protein
MLLLSLCQVPHDCGAACKLIQAEDEVTQRALLICLLFRPADVLAVLQSR